MGGRKKTHYNKLVEMAEKGNQKAIKLLKDIKVKK